VPAAKEAAARARRADTLALARAADPIPIGEAVMVAWARLVFECRRAGISSNREAHRRFDCRDCYRARLPVITQDEAYSLIADAHSELQVVTL
jgi:hypothetical protein